MDYGDYFSFLEDATGGICFIVDFEGAKLNTEFLGEFAQSSFGGEDAAAAGAVIGGFLATPAEGVGDGNCFLVDVESDVVNIGYGVSRY